MRINRDMAGGDLCDIYLDGEKLRYCIEADVREGWARCAVESQRGRLVADAAGFDGLRTEILRGKVQARFTTQQEPG